MIHPILFILRSIQGVILCFTSNVSNEVEGNDGDGGDVTPHIKTGGCFNIMVCDHINTPFSFLVKGF